MSQQPVPGHVNVIFDAGGQGCSVNSNPQRPKIIDPDPKLELSGSAQEPSFKIDWRIEDCLNVSDDFLAQVSNVAPCDLTKLPTGYRFESFPLNENGHRIQTTDTHGFSVDFTEVATGWRWKFTRKDSGVTPPEKLKPQEIEYDIFFSYKINQPVPIGSGRLYSLRQLTSVDPSVALPPKKSGGGTVGTKENFSEGEAR